MPKQVPKQGLTPVAPHDLGEALSRIVSPSPRTAEGAGAEALDSAGDADADRGCSRDTEKDFVLMSELENSFCAAHFFREFPWQALMPIVLPLYLAVRGRRVARNQSFLFENTYQIFVAWVLPLLVFALAAAAALGAAGELGVSNTELLTPLALHLMHRACVSMKYALLTAHEYRRFLNEPHLPRAVRWRQQMQVLTGWVQPGSFAPMPEVALAEIDVACRRNDIADAGSVLFECRAEEAPHWRAFLGSGTAHASQRLVCHAALLSGQEQPPSVDGCGHRQHRVSVRQVLTAIMNNAQPFNPKTALHCTTACSLLRMVIPGVHRIACGGGSDGEQASSSSPSPSFGGDGSATAAAVVGLSCLLSFFYYFVCSNFVLGALLHYARKERMVAMLGALPRLQRDEGGWGEGGGGGAALPLLRLDTAQNVRAWLYTREVLQDFGQRYHARLHMYLTIVGMGFVVILALALWKIVLASASDTGEALRCDMNMWYASVDVAGITTVLAGVLWFGAATNEQADVQVERFLKHRVRLRDSLRRSHPAVTCETATRTQLAALDECDMLLDTGVQALQAMQRASPVDVLGLEASRQLLVTLLTVSGSVLGLALQAMVTGTTSLSSVWGAG